MTKKSIFQSIAASLLLTLAVLVAAPVYGQTIVSHTTLSAAITSTSSQLNTFRLTSTTGIVANSTMLYIDGEADFVNAVTSTTVSVTRGQPTSRVSTHVNGALVWFGPPSQFYFANPIGYPNGSCTRSTASVLPFIDINNSVISDCLGGVWVNGDNEPAGATLFRLSSPNPGYVAYSSVGTDTTLAATTMYCTEIDLPYNKLLTGLAALNGATVTTDNHLMALYDASGNLLANSAVAGVVATTANVYQPFAFTSTYYAVGPATYFGCLQTNGTHATIRMLTTGAQDNILTKGVTGVTFGTLTSFTAPTGFTSVVGPYEYAY